LDETALPVIDIFFTSSSLYPGAIWAIVKKESLIYFGLNCHTIRSRLDPFVLEELESIYWIRLFGFEFEISQVLPDPTKACICCQ